VRETMVIFRRELKSCFLSPIAYVFGILFLALLLYFATGRILVNGMQASMQWFFSSQALMSLPFLLLIFVPGLTMRLWAEERKLGTIELLMTFPVRVWQPVLGKFAAAVVYLGFVMLLTLALPLTLAAYGRVDWPPVIAAYLASLLFASSFVAVGLFWSSLTKDQIVAMLATLVTLFVLYMLGYPTVIEGAADWLPATGLDLMNGISPCKYFESIARGVIDSRDIVYFACFCGFFLYANALVLRRLRHKG